MRFSVALPLLQSLFLSVANAAAYPLDSPPAAACLALSRKFSSEVFFPNTTDYASLNNYFSPTLAQHPACIFAPTSPTSAAASLPIVSDHRAQLAIRSGGHAFNANFSSSPSIILNLQRLKTLRLSADKKSVTLSPGFRWADVYEFLQPHGLGVTGGRAGDVGVGGFLLGGGISYSAYSRGMGCDDVVSFTVATVEGKVITASANENSDLFRALKGVGSPFVLVLSITMRTFPLGQVWQAATNQSVTQELFGAVADFRAADDTKAHLISTVQIFPGQDGKVADISASNFMYYSEPSATVPKTFEKVYRTAKQGDSVQQSNTTLLGAVGGGSLPFPSNFRFATWAWTLLSPDAELFAQASNSVNTTWRGMMSKGVVGAQLFFMQLGPRAGDGTNVLGLEKGKNYVVCLIVVGYVGAELDGEVGTTLEATVKEIEKEAKKKKIWSEWKYANYAHKKQEASLWEGYGRENVEFLRKVKAKYDPNGKWGNMVNGGWKIPRA